jgi:hypothetical protein
MESVRGKRSESMRRTSRMNTFVVRTCIGGTLLGVFGLGGCADLYDQVPEAPEEPIQVAAATGGAVGAGLGAVIGSQTGDALGGAVIGAAAGAGAGYAIGSVVEDREQRYAQQEEVLNRQDQTLRSQQQQLRELRELSGDQVSFKSDTGVHPQRYASHGGFAKGGLGQRGMQQARAAKGTTSSHEYRYSATSGKKRFIDPSSLRNPFAPKATPLDDTQRYARNTLAPQARNLQPRTVEVEERTLRSRANLNSPVLGSAVAPLRERSLQVPTSQGNSVVSTNEAPTARIPSIPPTPKVQEENPLNPRSSAAKVIRSNANETHRDSIEVKEEIEIGIQAPPRKKVAIARRVTVAPEENEVESSGIAVEVPSREEEVQKAPEPVRERVAKVKSTAPEKEEVQPKSREVATLPTLVENSDDCRKAAKEAQRGSSAESTADKLFYFRRALRLCPDAPEWHVELGQVYSSLGRNDDAKFEYEEALRIKPNYAAAESALEKLS